MGIEWTAEQKQVIESRNRNLLVSAAAGSGKTAVLVERIIRMITEGETPFGIDRLLVMTFTKAAAAEMRERVAEAIDRMLEEDPENIHLRVQAAMIPYAQIVTIDSFCLNLIREHYNKLDIDPAFSVGDQGELLLMQADVMKELLEAHYESGDQAFASFVEAYAQGKTDRGIDELIMQVYTFSQSNPWPGKWFDMCRQELQTEDETALSHAPWMEFLMQDVKLQTEELAWQMTEALAICEEENGPAPYSPMIASDLRILERLKSAGTYEELEPVLAGISFDKLAAVRSKDVDPDKKAAVSGSRDRMKKSVAKMKELYGSESVESVIAGLRGTAEPVSMLLMLAEEFDERYREAKKEKNLVDFNDLEHYALQVLLREEDGQFYPTEAADELSGQYEEILVDEYQDSNEVQEALVKSISRERFGSPNVFMVGDVKQSIYKFRLARPELFLEKYHSYQESEGPYQKIELHQNFRSRERVLSQINEVFYQIMTENLGGIHYTEETALHPGAAFEGCEGRVHEKSELLMVHTDGELLKHLDEDMADYTNRELEARLIAGKIRELTDEEHGLLIWDKKEKTYRTARLRDMVILLRSTSGWAEEFVNVLMNEGIPAYAELRTGYFTTLEVETILSVLRIIDNPMQDIPLAAVMKSPIGRLTDEELAYLSAYHKKSLKKGQDRGLYGAWKRFMEDKAGVDEGEMTNCPGLPQENGELWDSLYDKLNSFTDKFHGYSAKAEYLTIHELIYDIYETTGYYDVVSAMPAGDARRANLDMLIEKAVLFERTSYTGLFHFIRYIEKLQKYETDFGEASIAGDEDTVRIMSIHKSKGLEFPIVFLAAMGKKFNKQDAYGKILIDPDLGIGTDNVDLENRLKSVTLKKQVLKRKTELDALGEELRVLYVAMTRAKEKLIMTGTDRYLDRKLEKFKNVPNVKGQIPFTMLASADSYLDWVLMSLSGQLPDTGLLCDEMTDRAVETGTMFVSQIPIPLLVGQEMMRQESRRIWKEELQKLDRETVYDADYAEDIRQTMGFAYPHAHDVSLHAKLSVSELKKQSQVIEEESDYLHEPCPDESGSKEPLTEAAMDGHVEALPEPGPDDRLDAWNRAADALLMGSGATARQQQSGGAFRGTAYHRALELLDFSAIHSKIHLEQALQDMRDKKQMEEESIELIDCDVVYRFLDSELGRRMAKAQTEGHLYKERQFVIGIPAREMDLSDSDELVLIQGIIDAYFEENGQLILMDYKTDRVREDAELVKRYAVQLEYYKRALEQMTGKRVTEKLIYSLCLQKEVRIYN